ncbi:hypothetical protein WAE61_18195 [Comamonadaceae bacterium PP-2]
METVITGMFITTRGWTQGPSTNRPMAKRRDDGTFALRMPLINPQGKRSEAYVAIWEGPEAETWWKDHQGIGSGQPLHMVLTAPLIEPGIHSAAIHAKVRSCRLLPRHTSSPTTH